jgi:predicted DNA-binding mobile mystery protein A
MSVKATVQKQYRAKVDQAAAGPVHVLQRLPEGWIATVRKALGISGAQLGRLVRRTRANISAAERSEQEGRATLQTMKTLAEAMGCKFVYAFVPPDGGIEEILKQQARKKAQAIVQRANTHMALEMQNLNEDQLNDQIEGMARELLRNPPSDFWEDE